MLALRKFLQRSFPALITGGAGDDPAGVLTYTTIGGVAGFSQLWLLLLTTPLLVAAIAMAERVVRHSGMGLVAAMRKRFGRRLAVPLTVLLLTSNLATFAADTSAVAEVLQLLSGQPWEVFVLPLLGLIYLLFSSAYSRVRSILSVLALVLLVYALAALLARPDWGQVLGGLLFPKVVLKPDWLVAALGLLGTTISPYMLFWHGNQELEEMRLQPSRASHAEEPLTLWLGMGFSNLVSVFIVVAAAQALHGQQQIATVLDAARALEPLGPAGTLVFVLGIVGAGLLALPVFAATSAYAMAELFGWERGLGQRAAEARGFYWVLAGAAVGGALISLLPNFNPADALFYSQVFNGMLLPVLMVVLLLLSNDARVVRQGNPVWVNVSALITVLLSAGVMVAALLSR